MKKIAFSALPISALPAEAGSVSRQFTGGENITIAKITFAADSSLPGHRHVNEQYTVVLEGALRFFDENGGTTDVHAGEVMYLPSNVWHGAKSLTETIVLDVFSPVRADWGTPPEPASE